MHLRIPHCVTLILAASILPISATISAAHWGPRNADRCRIKVIDNDINVTLPMALAMFKQETGHFPTTEQGLLALIERPAYGPGSDGTWQGPYLKKRDIPRDPWGQPYNYLAPGVHNPDSFDLWSWGRDGKKSRDDVGNWKTAGTTQSDQTHYATRMQSKSNCGNSALVWAGNKIVGLGVIVLVPLLLNFIIGQTAAWMAASLIWIP